MKEKQGIKLIFNFLGLGDAIDFFEDLMKTVDSFSRQTHISIYIQNPTCSLAKYSVTPKPTPHLVGMIPGGPVKAFWSIIGSESDKTPAPLELMVEMGEEKKRLES